MTTPDERVRALVWGQELLEELRHDISAPRELVDKAVAIGQTYPNSGRLHSSKSSVLRWPLDVVASINSARALFVSVLSSPDCSDEMRRHALHTLRHFPLRGETVMVEMGPAFDVSNEAES